MRPSAREARWHRSTCAPTPSPAPRPGCAPRWPRPRSATTSSATTPRSTSSRSGSPTLLGKEAALWFPTGTMANQVVLRALTSPGDDVIVSGGSHAVWHETGGSGANAGVQLTEIGGGGLVHARRSSRRRSSLAAISSTRRRRSSRSRTPTTGPAASSSRPPRPPRSPTRPASSGSRRTSTERGSGTRPSSLVAASPTSPLRSTWSMVSLSKGLGAPGGSVVAARRDLIPTLVRYRRMSGGAMRQVGIFAAAGLWALDHNLDRLAEDHANARAIAERLAESPAYVIDPSAVETNILVWQVADEAPRRADDRGAGPRARRADLRPGPADVPGGHPPRRDCRGVRGRGRHPRRGLERLTVTARANWLTTRNSWPTRPNAAPSRHVRGCQTRSARPSCAFEQAESHSS